METTPQQFRDQWLHTFTKAGYPLKQVEPGGNFYRTACALDPFHYLSVELPSDVKAITVACHGEAFHGPDRIASVLRAMGHSFDGLADSLEQVHERHLDDLFEESVQKRLEQKRVNDEADRRYLEELFGEPEVLEQRTLAEMLMEPDEEPDYRIQGLWPSGGNVILAAQRKTGKTTMVGNLIRCLVDGGSFLSQDEGWLIGSNRHLVRPIEPDQTVSLLDCEMARRQVRSWLSVHQIKNPDRIYVDTLRGCVHSFDFMSRQGLIDWAERLRKRNTKILIVDPLGPVLVANGVDNENDNSGIRKILMGLDRLCREAEIEELLIPHHAGHNGERSRGASVLRDWPDVEWKLVRDKPEEVGGEPTPDGPRFFSAEGRDVLVTECQLGYDPTTRRLWIEGGTRKEASGRAKLPILMEYIRNNPGQSLTKIRDGIKGPGGMFGRAVAEALKTGMKDKTLHSYKDENAMGKPTGYVLSDGCQSPENCPSARTAMINSTGFDQQKL